MEVFKLLIFSSELFAQTRVRAHDTFFLLIRNQKSCAFFVKGHPVTKRNVVQIFANFDYVAMSETARLSGNIFARS